MWQAIVNSPDSETRSIELKTGKLKVGRASSNDIVIDDSSASRNHAEFELNTAQDLLTITDLNSTNGTYVNRQRIEGLCQLSPNDIIRIGQVTIFVNQIVDGVPTQVVMGTHRFTRELLLESLDEHAVLLFEVSRKLNTVLDVGTALKEVTEMLKRTMLVERCEILLAKQLKDMSTQDFEHPLAKAAIENHSAEVSPTDMFVPILAGEEVLGLMCLYKFRPGTRPFNRRDLQLAIAISHQASLTLQRMSLLRKVRNEEQVHRLLMRFVSPMEAEYILKDYLKTGKLPGLSVQRLTVMFADIADSTRMAELMGPIRFANILGHFYREATEIFFQHGGIVKYLGDGILAVFTDHGKDDGLHMEERAVLAAQDLRTRINRTGSLVPEERIVVGLTINTGEAVAGYVGTKERTEFVVLGDTVNVAYRMQDYARPYRIIVGPATVAAIAGKYHFHRVGAVSLRGREQTIQAYEVLP